MSDKPIIFSGPMVRALLAGNKTQTRRLLPSAHPSFPGYHQLRTDVLLDPQEVWYWDGLNERVGASYRLRIDVGDRLYVREGFNAFQFSQDGDEAWPVKVPTLAECKEAEELGHRYGAPQIVFRESDRARKWFADQKWRPSIHMPRWASRLTLTVTDVRVQRLQNISEADAAAEGVTAIGSENGPDSDERSFVWAFHQLWNEIHGPDAWHKNPWVAAYTFTVARGNIDQGAAHV